MPVELSGVRSYTPEQVERLQKEIGMTGVRTARMIALPELGRLAKELGIIETIKGSTLVGQETIVACLVAAGRIVDDDAAKPKAKQEAMRLVGYLTGALSKLNLTVVKVDATVAEVTMEVDKQRRNSFKAGMAVRPPKPK